MNGKTGRDLARERRRALKRAQELELHTMRGCCPGCGAAAWLSGGTGCTCGSDSFQLAVRCVTNAERTRQREAIRKIPRQR